MNSSDNISPSKHFALMLIGTPKSGKTVVGLCFPNPYILDIDNNLMGALTYHKNRDGKKFTYYFDDPNTVPLPKRFNKACEDLDTAINDSNVDSIFVDGLSLLGSYLEAHILANSVADHKGKLLVAGEQVMSQSYWGPFKNKMMRLIMNARTNEKPFIMSCHEATLTNDKGAVIGYRPLISGQLKNSIAGLFSDVWRCESTSDHTGAHYKLRFSPKNLMQIGNSLGIAADTYETTNKTRDEIWKYLNQYIGI